MPLAPSGRVVRLSRSVTDGTPGQRQSSVCLLRLWRVFTLSPEVERGRRHQGRFLEEECGRCGFPKAHGTPEAQCPLDSGLFTSEACEGSLAAGPQVLSALCRPAALTSDLCVTELLPPLQAHGVLGAEPVWPLLLDVARVPWPLSVRNQRQQSLCSWCAVRPLWTPAPVPGGLRPLRQALSSSWFLTRDRLGDLSNRLTLLLL